MDGTAAARHPTVVVLGVDPRLRRVVRRGLERDGVAVVEGDSIEAARQRTGEGSEIRGVVIDVGVARLPDPALLDALADEWPGAPVVVLDEGADPDELATLRRRLAREGRKAGTVQGLRAAAVVREHAEELADAWRELCRWDPMLPPESEPPMAVRMVRAVGEALSRPQPLGWGPDPEVEEVTEAFATSAGSVEVAVGELVCLREALKRRLDLAVPAAERGETLERLSMVIDRAIGVAAIRTARQLEHEALVDPLTGLLNRRALERDLRREIARAGRLTAVVTVMVVDVDGLKAVNDTEGHLAGDQYLRTLSVAFVACMRAGDAAYRVGGDEFVVVLPDADADTAELVAARAVGAGAPPFSWGAATYPGDGETIDLLLGLADRRLFDGRRAKAPGPRGAGR